MSTAAQKLESKHSFSPGVRRVNPEVFKADHDYVAALSPRNEKPKKRIRQSEPKMNQLEAEFWRYMASRFDYQRLYGTVKLRLANGCWYCPDFIRITPELKWLAYEVKGPHSWEDSIVKLKVAATAYPYIEFRLVWKDGGRWQEQVVLP